MAGCFFRKPGAGSWKKIGATEAGDSQHRALLAPGGNIFASIASAVALLGYISGKKTSGAAILTQFPFLLLSR